MDVDFEFTLTRLAKIANTNNLSAYRELWSGGVARLQIAGKSVCEPELTCRAGSKYVKAERMCRTTSRSYYSPIITITLWRRGGILPKHPKKFGDGKT